MTTTYPIDITIRATGYVAPYGIGEIVDAVTADDAATAAKTIREAVATGHQCHSGDGDRLSLDEHGDVVVWTEQ